MAANNTGYWTDTRIAQLQELAGTEMSVAEIAEELGCTRNAVIGKLNRLKNPRLHYEPSSRNTKPRVRRTFKIRPRPTAPRPQIQCDGVEPMMLTFAELQPYDCRWPYGDGPFHFCGHAQWGDSSYCEHHQAESITERRGYANPHMARAA